MPAPTVNVTVSLSDLGGVALEGVVVTATLDINEVYDGIVIAKQVRATTDETGVAVLELFPNAPDPAGLGTQGSTYRVTASVPGGRPLDVFARVPNTDCNLHEILVVDEPAVPLTAAEMAVLQAQQSAVQAGQARDEAVAVIEDPSFISVVGALAAIGAVAAIAAAVTTVAGVAAAVVTVAGIAAAVVTVAGISANVTTVAGISANVTTVAGADANVGTVAGSIANVNTVAGSIANVNTNAANIVAIQGAAAAAAAAAASAATAATTITAPNDLQLASFARCLQTKALRYVTRGRPKMGIGIGLGQSLMAPRNAVVFNATGPDLFMASGGNSTNYFQFYATNAEHIAHWTDASGMVAHTEGSLQTPLSGIAAGLRGGPFQALYLTSVAIGARTVRTLNGAGPRCNLAAVIHKACDAARAAGYEPVVFFSVKESEADMAAGSTEASFYDGLGDYIDFAQFNAALAMDRPDYDAPVLYHYAVTTQYGAANIAVNKAIYRRARATRNGMLVGAFQHSTESDRTHHDATGMTTAGEEDGYIFRDFFTKGILHFPLELTYVVRNGATVSAYFSREVANDFTLTFGTSLNAAIASLGCEYSYDGVNLLALSAPSLKGSRIDFTLSGGSPGAHAGTEFFRIASQVTTGTLTAGQAFRAGTPIYSNTPDNGHLSIFDFTFRTRRMAAPMQLAVA